MRSSLFITFITAYSGGAIAFSWSGIAKTYSPFHTFHRVVPREVQKTSRFSSYPLFALKASDAAPFTSPVPRKVWRTDNPGHLEDLRCVGKIPN